MPKLVILDGNSLLYRGFFAMRALSTTDHLPTNAIYSFVLMLMTILEREKPDAIFAAFDPPGPTFRHQELDTYKGTRLTVPDGLGPQRAPAREAARAFRVPVIEVPGFEADDVVGTLADQGKNLGYETLIVTGDGDALQLVDDVRGPVRVMMTVRGVTDTITYDGAAVQKRYGLSPTQLPDFKALKGDPSDNMPGVPGIGEKGASRLLKEYGTLENLLAHAGDLPEKTRAALKANRDLAVQTKRLATVVRDVPLPDWVDLSPDYQSVGPDFDAIRALFDRLEFRALLKRLPALAPRQSGSRQATNSVEQSMAREVSSDGAGGDGDISLVDSNAVPHTPRFAAFSPTFTADSPKGLAALADRLRGTGELVGVQLHTEPARATLMQAALRGIAFAFSDALYYAPWHAGRLFLTPYLEDAASAKAVHDLKFVSGVLGRAGITIRGAVFDTLLAAYLLNAGRAAYPLPGLAADHLGLELIEKSEDPASGVREEAGAIRALEPELRRRLEADGLTTVFDEIELPLSPILADMEREGVSVDPVLLAGVSQAMGEQITMLEGEIYALAGMAFSIGSTKQLQDILFNRLNLPVGKKTKTGYSTGAEVLEDLASKGHEIAQKIIEWRELSKLKSTYADAIPALINPETGRVHTSLNQTVASTGRLSSSNPNLQNIPIRTEVGREIRRAFVAAPGRVLVSADYSQIELRIYAHITKDPGLVQAFLADEDIHERTARRIFNIKPGIPVTGDQRRQAKTINFAVIYGASPWRVAAELGISQAAAAGLIKAYLAQYPGVRKYLEQVLADARVKGYVRTLFGRRRYVPDINSRVYQFRQAAEREAANMPVQGTSADIIKLAMIRVDQAIKESGLQASMVLQVHDELLFESSHEEVPRLAALVKNAMEHAYPLDVTLRADVKSGHNWWDVTSVEAEDSEILKLAA